LGGQVNNATVMSSTFSGAVQGHSMGFSSGSTERHGRTLWNHGSLQTSILALQPVNETWNHLALTYDAALNTLTLYVNGQEVGSDLVDMFMPFSSLNVGRREASGTQQLAGMVDEVMVYDRVFSAGEIQSLYEDSLEQGVAPLREVGLRIESNEQTGPDEMALKFRTFWPNQLHEVYGKTNLTDPAWQMVAGAVVEPDNVEVYRATVPIENQPSEFLRAAAFPGAAIFSEDFESGAAGWTHGGANDSWELGAPTTGPGAAHSGTNVYATGLASDYLLEANAYLRSPEISLVGVSSARLHFWEYRDIYPNIGAHRGTINILEAGTLTEIDDVFRASGTNGGWTEWYVDLPNAAYGTNVVIEFQLETDPFDPRPGWYIDDVEILPY
jgi:hypothetical protein